MGPRNNTEPHCCCSIATPKGLLYSTGLLDKVYQEPTCTIVAEAMQQAQHHSGPNIQCCRLLLMFSCTHLTTALWPRWEDGIACRVKLCELRASKQHVGLADGPHVATGGALQAKTKQTDTAGGAMRGRELAATNQANTGMMLCKACTEGISSNATSTVLHAWPRTSACYNSH